MPRTVRTSAPRARPDPVGPGPYAVAVIAACPLPAPRGTPVRILRLSEALAERGHAVHVVAYHLGEGDVSDGVTVHRTPALPTYRRTSPGPSWQKLLLVDPLLVATLRRVLTENRFDVIHAHHYEGLLAALAGARDTGLPVIYDAHTLLGSELPTYRLGLPRIWLRDIGRRLDAWLPRRADRVVAVTEAIAARLAALGVDPERITVASNGIEREFLEAARLPHAAPREPATLSFAGNLAPYQRVDLLLETFRLVRAARPESRLHVVTGSSFAPYEELARALGVRESLDVVACAPEDVPVRLARSTVAVNPRTECDGIPLKLLNYMASGCAIASFAGAAPILRDGETGALVRDGDTAALAGAIVGLLDDPDRARRLGENAREYVRRHHGWPEVAARVEDVYRCAIQARRARGP